MLARLGRWLFLLLAAVLLAWIFLFALFNDTWVPLHLVWLELPAGRLSWWLLLSFLLGLLSGCLLPLLLRKRPGKNRLIAPSPVRETSGAQ